MLSKARAKIQFDKVKFIQADITKDWDFAIQKYDLVGFSLVLEQIFNKVGEVTLTGSYLYGGELHPFKQYV